MIVGTVNKHMYYKKIQPQQFLDIQNLYFLPSNAKFSRNFCI